MSFTKESKSKRWRVRNGTRYDTTVDNKSAKLIPSSKVKSFIILFDFIAKHHGSDDKAFKQMRTSNNFRTLLNNNHISEHYARKILEEYNRIKAIK